ncbi:hypothetical protein TNIN_105271 [Trichonephila inaurata madagascariensis]|uniref:Uncharacterized protein n=1 Tax=Trichonephila inaurata madagascariensis TaxID=2747483 RepID=A0A8X6X574_9ARAC|nr:hypothetical protein TNIN_105271 [Trichonephila inaurata madagascariensis]
MEKRLPLTGEIEFLPVGWQKLYPSANRNKNSPIRHLGEAYSKTYRLPGTRSYRTYKNCPEMDFSPEHIFPFLTNTCSSGNLGRFSFPGRAV